MFKDGKVYAEVDEQGELVVRDGVVKIRYRENDDREYSARASAVSEIDESRIAAARAAKKKTKKKSTRSSSSSSSGARSSGVGPVGGFPSSAGTVAKMADESDVPDGAVVVYTDGACFGNPGPMGAGVVLIFGNNRREISQYLGDHGTNNIAELQAVRIALEAIKDRSLPVRVFSDSTYVIGLLTRGWKAKENKEIVAALREVASQFDDLALVKVKGHAGIELNERVDELAKLAIEERR